MLDNDFCGSTQFLLVVKVEAGMVCKGYRPFVTRVQGERAQLLHHTLLLYTLYLRHNNTTGTLQATFPEII